mgnify:CR=1 FL=1
MDSSITIPQIFLSTDRINLRRLDSSDRELLQHLFCDDGMMKYLGSPWTEAEVDEVLEEWQREWGKNNYWYGAMVEKQSGSSIGIAGITEDTNPDEPGLEFSWFVLPEFQKRGFAAEITQAMMQFAFNIEKKERLFASTHPQNPASNTVLQKLGFRNLGLRHQVIDYLPNFEEQVVWEYLRSDWLINHPGEN